MKLSENIMYFVNLRKGHKSVKDMNINFVKRELMAILDIAYTDIGQLLDKRKQQDIDILSFQTESLFKEAMRLPFLTIPEIQEAFIRGIRKESGTFYGMCPQTYAQFLKWFASLPERSKSWLAYIESLETKEPHRNNGIPNPEGQKKVIEILKANLPKMLDIPDRQPVDREKLVIPKKTEKSPRDRFIQSVLTEFDKIIGSKESMFIEYDGKMVNVSEYLEIKVKEYDIQSLSLQSTEGRSKIK